MQLRGINLSTIYGMELDIYEASLVYVAAAGTPTSACQLNSLGLSSNIFRLLLLLNL